MLATVAMIIASAVLIWVNVVRRGPQSPSKLAQVPKDPISLADAAGLGNSDARVAIIEYSDFQCPFCRTFARDTLPELKRRYADTGKVIFVFRHLPAESRKFALRAAESAECARRQGKFWQMHDAFFGNQAGLDEVGIVEQAKKLGLDPAAFSACMAGQGLTAVRRDEAEGTALGISGTPSFLFGTIETDGRVRVVSTITGAQPIAEFVRAIEELLAGRNVKRKWWWPF